MQTSIQTNPLDLFIQVDWCLYIYTDAGEIKGQANQNACDTDMQGMRENIIEQRKTTGLRQWRYESKSDHTFRFKYSWKKHVDVFDLLSYSCHYHLFQQTF